jgi:hypothetical protein
MFDQRPVFGTLPDILGLECRVPMRTRRNGDPRSDRRPAESRGWKAHPGASLRSSDKKRQTSQKKGCRRAGSVEQRAKRGSSHVHVSRRWGHLGEGTTEPICVGLSNYFLDFEDDTELPAGLSTTNSYQGSRIRQFVRPPDTQILPGFSARQPFPNRKDRRNRLRPLEIESPHSRNASP